MRFITTQSLRQTLRGNQRRRLRCSRFAVALYGTVAFTCLMNSCSHEAFATRNAEILTGSITREDVARIERLLKSQFPLITLTGSQLRFEIRKEVAAKGIGILNDDMYWLEWMQNRVNHYTARQGQ